MDSRKVIKIKKSHYINIPSEISQALGIVKGDRLKIIHLPGSGILITLDQGAGKVSVNLQSIDRLQRAADAIYSQLEGRVKDLGLNFISNLQARIVSDLAVSGLLDLKARVDKIETRQATPQPKVCKIHLLKKRSPNHT
jgi:bifunctional DNA-binding transcriptional regulator/antitoxin component of YhaV-PrlF toxin-antitoxin module